MTDPLAPAPPSAVPPQVAASPTPEALTPTGEPAEVLEKFGLQFVEPFVRLLPLFVAHFPSPSVNLRPGRPLMLPR